MHEYRVFLRTGAAVTVRAGAFTKNKDEVLFFEDEVARERNDEPVFEHVVAAFRHEELAGFARTDHLGPAEGPSSESVPAGAHGPNV
jgi:hypothetical protein